MQLRDGLRDKREKEKKSGISQTFLFVTGDLRDQRVKVKKRE